MKYVAYHRTSTKDQHLDRGIAELTKYCADNAISLYKGRSTQTNRQERTSTDHATQC